MPQKKNSKKHLTCQERRDYLLFCNELDDHFSAIGPRLFNDNYYDETLTLGQVKRRNNDKGSKRKS